MDYAFQAHTHDTFRLFKQVPTHPLHTPVKCHQVKKNIPKVHFSPCLLLPPPHSPPAKEEVIMKRHMPHPRGVLWQSIQLVSEKMMLIIGDNENLLSNHSARGVVQLINRDFNPRIQFLLLVL